MNTSSPYSIIKPDHQSLLSLGIGVALRLLVHIGSIYSHHNPMPAKLTYSTEIEENRIASRDSSLRGSISQKL